MDRNGGREEIVQAALSALAAGALGPSVPAASPAGMSAPGLNGTRRELVNSLKRRGSATIPLLSEEARLNVETVRHHLQALTAEGLVERRGTRRSGPGRPEVVYALTAASESLFPRREGEVLRGLVMHLVSTGNEALLEEFFDEYIAERRDAALTRVAGLEGPARAEEAARILSELGFMALAHEGAEQPELRLCHCPLREVVDVTRVPCRAELAFVRELMGERLTRLNYIPAGDASCTYRRGAA
ncbi:MAG: ArsR family transcriptional regulator [Gemmatimonadetes bacterium]|nr:ArsR family transcriptional regulator [Gemmatimonadota bacterium]